MQGGLRPTESFRFRERRGIRRLKQQIRGCERRRADQAFRIDSQIGTPGTLSYANGVLHADIDGDGVPDFQLGLVGAPALAASDLLL